MCTKSPPKILFFFSNHQRWPLLMLAVCYSPHHPFYSPHPTLLINTTTLFLLQLATVELSASGLFSTFKWSKKNHFKLKFFFFFFFFLNFKSKVSTAYAEFWWRRIWYWFHWSDGWSAHRRATASFASASATSAATTTTAGHVPWEPFGWWWHVVTLSALQSAFHVGWRRWLHIADTRIAARQQSNGFRQQVLASTTTATDSATTTTAAAASGTDHCRVPATSDRSGNAQDLCHDNGATQLDGSGSYARSQYFAVGFQRFSHSA